MGDIFSRSFPVNYEMVRMAAGLYFWLRGEYRSCFFCRAAGIPVHVIRSGIGSAAGSGGVNLRPLLIDTFRLLSNGIGCNVIHYRTAQTTEPRGGGSRYPWVFFVGVCGTP